MLAVILAGGKSRRMGSNKAKLQISGEETLERLVRLYREYFDVAISMQADGQQKDFGARRLVDVYPGKGPLAGLHAAFAETKEDKIFLTATDLPFGDPVLALHMVQLLGDTYDACVIRRKDGGIEPLFSAYNRRCLPVVAACLAGDRLSMRALLDQVHTRIVREEELPTWELEHILLNMNTPAQYHAVQSIQQYGMPVLSFVGWSGSGKTTFLEKLLPVLTERGIRVGLIKHDAHKIEMDKPGKDTDRLYKAGASAVAISNQEMLAVIQRCDGQPELAELLSHIRNVDIVLTEGYKTGDNLKIEIHRQATGKKPACLQDERLLAVITDEKLDTKVPQLGLEDVEQTADIIENLLCRF